MKANKTKQPSNQTLLDFLKFQLSPYLSKLREAADAPLLEVFTDRLDGALSNESSKRQGVGTKGSLRFLPTQTCDSMIIN